MEKERNYLFDNYKVFLIYLVVLGHFVSPSFHETGFLEGVKWFIFAFHMPAFMFVSGFFSKKVKSVGSLVQKLLIPYLIFELLYFVIYMIIGKDTELALLYPKFTLWYLFALFMFKLVGNVLLKLKIPAPIAIIAALAFSLAWGFSDFRGSLLTNQRAVYFFPYYLLGMYMNMDHVEKLRTNIAKKISWIIIALFLLFLAFDPIHKKLSISVTYGRYSYDSLGFDPAIGILIKSMCYVFGFILTFAFLSVLTDKKNKLSWIGPNTLSVYLFHGLLFKILETKSTLLQDLDTPIENILLLVGCAIVTYIFALEPFNKITNAFANISLKKNKN